MDIDNMFDSLYETVKEADIPIILGMIHDGEVKALVSGSGKNLSIMIACIIKNISETTGIPAAIIMFGILHNIKIDDEGSEEING